MNRENYNAQKSSSVRPCLEGPALQLPWCCKAGSMNPPPSFSQCRTTVILPLLSMIFHEGTWSCRPIEYRVSQTIVGMASITEIIQRRIELRQIRNCSKCHICPELDAKVGCFQCN
jgi:hypothetical protein